MKDNRPDIDEYFMLIADIVRKRSTSPKEKVGAVLVRDKYIISTGYNGAAVGEPHEDEGHLIEDSDGHSISAVHAELNAIIQAARHGHRTDGARLYCTHFPCRHCMKYLKNAGITTIYYMQDYKNAENIVDLSAFEIQQITEKSIYKYK